MENPHSRCETYFIILLYSGLYKTTVSIVCFKLFAHLGYLTEIQYVTKRNVLLQKPAT